MFGRKAKIRKAVDRALAPVVEERDLADHAPIEALPVELQPTAYFNLAHALFDDERYVAAKHTADRALTLAPDEPDLHRLSASIHRELGNVAAAISAQRRVVAAAPQETAPALALAELLITTEQFDEAIALLRSFAHDRGIG